MSLTVEQLETTVLVRDRDHTVIASGDRLVIHGCDTSVPAGAALTINGHQATWTEGSVVHVSDQRRRDAGEGPV